MTDTWPDDVDLHVTGIAQGGDGVGRWEGRAVFASGALPGEHVRAHLSERQRAFARGTTLAVHTAAPERVASPCPLEDRCGGGDWRWIDYQAQLRYKATILEEQMRHIGRLEVQVAAVHGMPERHQAVPRCAAGAGWGYRTTAEMHAAGGKLGYFAPGSRRVADIPQCCLHHVLIDAALAALRSTIDRRGIELRSLTLRSSPATETVLGIVETGDARTAVHRLAQEWMDACSVLRGVVQRTRSGMTTVLGEDHLIQRLSGLSWHVSAGSFFQVNAEQTGRLIERMGKLVQPEAGEQILDLFCGVGTFALPLAQAGAIVTGVEVYAPAIQDAQRSVALNQLAIREWHTGPVEAILAQLTGPYDAAVLDPPRRGCDSQALEHLLRLRPRRIVYVACHPGTLARDCRVLSEGGYTVERVELIDLFPQTHHIESIVLLRNG